jgi:DNA-binding NarL/FixJ family response regulator
MSKMSRIALLHQEGYSAEYIARELKTDTLTIKKIIYGDKK